MNDRESRVVQLIEELGVYGIECAPERAELMIRHLELLVEKNKVVNLTRITDDRDAVTLHLVDSLLPLTMPEVTLGADFLFLDLGTGGGFPGVPLGVMTEARGLLVDSVGKKVKAVAEFVEQLGLANLKTQHVRAEELALQMPSSFDFVFARAVAQTNVLIEYATPLLKQSGLLVVEKGRPTDEEVEAATRAAAICGLELVSRETFELSRNLGHREVFLYRKVRKSSIKLPRKTGDAKHSPLGIA